MKRIAVFASGSGTNFQAIVDYFRNHKEVEVSLLLSDKPGSGAVHRAEKEDIPVALFTKDELFNSNKVVSLLLENRTDLIVLAGFLLLIPPSVISEYEGRIINIHPALLPKYGGKGMYGLKVHEAVIRNGETLTGITIHCIDEEYDRGSIIFQATCNVLPDDTPESLSKRIQELEHKYYPRVIEKLLVGD